MAGCQKLKPVFVILTVYFLMAIMNILLKMILDEGISKLVIMTYRLTAATIFLAPVAYLFERSNGLIRLTTPILCQLFFSALLGATLTQCMFLVGMKYTSAAFSSAFTNMTPVITFLLALIVRQESVEFRTRGGMAKVLGSLICLGSAILLMLYRGIPLNNATHSTEYSYSPNNRGVGTSWIIGSFFVLISVVCWSSWFLIQARIGKMYPFKYSSTTFMTLFGAIQSAILCLAINRDINIWILRGKLQILTVLFAGIFGSGVCYVGMSWCVQQRGPVFTAAFSPFVPIFITTLDLAFFHEQIYLGSIVGSILMMCGLYVLLWGKSNGEIGTITKPTEVVNPNRSTTSASDATEHQCPASDVP